MKWNLEAIWGLAAGILLTIPFFWISSRRSAGGRRRLFTLIVAVTHLPYLGFAWAWQPAALGQEALLLLPFLGAAWLGGRLFPWMLGLGLAGHSLVDCFHPLSGGEGFAPHWYRWACVSFDWLLGSYALWAVRDSSHSTS